MKFLVCIFAVVVFLATFTIASAAQPQKQCIPGPSDAHEYRSCPSTLRALHADGRFSYAVHSGENLTLQGLKLVPNADVTFLYVSTAGSRFLPAHSDSKGFAQAYLTNVVCNPGTECCLYITWMSPEGRSYVVAYHELDGY